MFLIRFTYDHYCQGYEDATETLLVYADSFDDACDMIRVSKYENPRDFRNLTLR